jgi:four helix bundle suffix protein
MHMPQFGVRTVDQMRQAARSCKQNIVEGISDGTVSVEMSIKLLGVARGSVRELGEDYEDYLRQHGLTVWPVNDPRTEATRKYCLTHLDSTDFIDKCRNRTDETVANIMLTMVHQVDAALGLTLKNIEDEFLANGGIREAMTRARLSSRNNQ